MSVYDIARENISRDMDRIYQTDYAYHDRTIGFTKEELEVRMKQVFLNNMRPVYEQERKDRQDILDKLDDMSNKNKRTTYFILSCLGISALAMCAKCRLIICAFLAISIYMQSVLSLIH